MDTDNQPRTAYVRAIPMTGYSRRWCGSEKWVEDKVARPNTTEKHGLPWPDAEVRVSIVDEPKPFDPNVNGGVPIEISPTTLQMLERDPRMAVRVLSGDGGDPAEIIHVKASVTKLEGDLAEARREASGLIEQLKSLKAVSDQQITDQASKIALLEHELASARAQLGVRRKGNA